jgi:hypothetical protein
MIFYKAKFLKRKNNMNNYYVKYNLTNQELNIKLYPGRSNFCMFEHTFMLHEIKQIVNGLDSNDVSEIISDSSLSELYMSLRQDILTVGVAYGGPCVHIQISPYLYGVFKKSLKKMQ